MAKPGVFQHLYVRVIVGVVLGVAVGLLAPAWAVQLKPLGDGFIKLIKMLIGPVVFVTVVLGIANAGDLKQVGRTGVKAIAYFETLSTLSLAIGLLVVHWLKPGVGLNANPAVLGTQQLQTYASAAKSLNWVDFLLELIPTTLTEAFAKGDVLPILLVAMLFGMAIARHRHRFAALIGGLDQVSEALFGVIGLIVQLAPLGAFGAMAFTVAKFGLGTLWSLGKLMLGVYATCFLFVFVILGLVSALVGLDLLKLLRYLGEELAIVLGTSSSEAALPRLMDKLERLGCDRAVVGLVVPAGYSFNLDGTSIYLSMAAVFIAQATNTPLSPAQEGTLLVVLMLTSKGAAAVTGGGFITLAATLASLGTIPIAGMTLLLGVDRFMSEARALTNLIGNAIGSLVVARWEGRLDLARARRVLNGEVPPPEGLGQQELRRPSEHGMADR
jgi:aerobic C4-dicarboxylate transport protein